MGRPRKPTAALELSGAFKRNPQRRRDRADEPEVEGPVGRLRTASTKRSRPCTSSCCRVRRRTAEPVDRARPDRRDRVPRVSVRRALPFFTVHPGCRAGRQREQTGARPMCSAPFLFAPDLALAVRDLVSHNF
jgi:hypothetical protein